MPVNHALTADVWQAYVTARDGGHTEYCKKAKKCDNYFAGIQWDPLIQQQLKQHGKPALTINKVLATLAAVMGEQLQNRADISFRPMNEGTAEVANALSKVYIQVGNNNKLEWLEAKVADDGFITSRGFFDARIDFGDNMRGEVKINVPNPRNIVIDPEADDYDPDNWKEVWHTKWLTADDIALLYNQEDANYLADKAASSFDMHGYDSIDREHNTFGGLQRFGNLRFSDEQYRHRRRIRVLERQYRVLKKAFHFVDLETGDTRQVPLSWDQSRVERVAAEANLGVFQKQVQAIRWVVTADNVVLFDDLSPYKHFTVIPYFPFFRRGKTIGLAENLLSPQDQLNKSSSQELHIVNSTANSGWIFTQGNLVNMQPEDLENRGAETGIIIEVQNLEGIKKIQPNQIPTGLDRIGFKADEFIKEISGISDSTRGFDRADVAAKAIQAKQAAGSVNLAKPLDNLTRTRHLLAHRVLDLVQEYYTEERIIQIVGEPLNPQVETLVVNQVQPTGQVVNDLTVGEYDVVVTTVPARDTFAQTQLQEAKELRDLGVPIPDYIMVKHSTLSDKSELVEQLRKAAQGGEKTEMDRQLQMLELQEKQVKNELAQAQAQNEKAEAMLNAVRARQTAQELLNPDSGQAADNAQREREAGDRVLAQRRLEEELSLKRQEIAAKIQIEREKLDQQRRSDTLKNLLANVSEGQSNAGSKSNAA